MTKMLLKVYEEVDISAFTNKAVAANVNSYASLFQFIVLKCYIADHNNERGLLSRPYRT